MLRISQITRELEVTLGPDTADLSMRFGLHSGPVTAGVSASTAYICLYCCMIYDSKSALLTSCALPYFRFYGENGLDFNSLGTLSILQQGWKGVSFARSCLSLHSPSFLSFIGVIADTGFFFPLTAARVSQERFKFHRTRHNC